MLLGLVWINREPRTPCHHVSACTASTLRAIVAAICCTACFATRDATSLATSALVSEYIATHRVSTEDLVESVRQQPCARQFVSADFWGRGLGNSINTPLNALALAIATNRTLLLSADKQYQAGFWRYLGDVTWAREY